MAMREEVARDGDATAGGGVVAWAVLGVAAILALAVVRLGIRGVVTIRAGLTPGEWALLAVATVAFVYGEGYRALQRRWVPFVIGRARRLDPGSPVAYRVLAPLYAMGLVGGPARTAVRAWAGVLAIVGAVLLVRLFPEPWRGITDFAVAAALAWGLLALIRGGLGGSATAAS